MGESQPVAPNTLPNGKDNPEGRAQNRRVEITTSHRDVPRVIQTGCFDPAVSLRPGSTGAFFYLLAVPAYNPAPTPVRRTAYAASHRHPAQRPLDRIPVEPEQSRSGTDTPSPSRTAAFSPILPREEAATPATAPKPLPSNLDQHVLIPGLVNAHTHASMTLLRGLADDLPLDDLVAGPHLAGRGALGRIPISSATAP
jgi:hypothetical protein